jgi:glycosyltransferase involved in cell wall biosynthesis
VSAGAPPAVEGPILLAMRGFPRASETFIFNLFIGLLERGHDVHVQAWKEDRTAWSFYPHHPSRAELADRLHFGPLTGDLLDKLRPAIVHAQFGWSAPGALDAIDDRDIALVVSLRGTDIRVHGYDTPGYYDRVWRRVDLVHTVSEALWRDARSRGCGEFVPHRVSASPIDLAFFQRERPTPPATRIGTPDRPVRLLTIARLEWQKGLDYGLTAVRQLVDAGIALRYLILGEGSSREELVYTIGDLGLGDVVTLAGAVDRNRVRRELEAADILLQPSVTEGLPTVLGEAQAMGVPVVTSDAGGSGEAVTDGETGFVVPRRDAGALAAALLTLVGDPELRHRFGATGQLTADRFSATLHLECVEAMYREALDNRRGFTPCP